VSKGKDKSCGIDNDNQGVLRKNEDSIEYMEEPLCK